IHSPSPPASLAISLSLHTPHAARCLDARAAARGLETQSPEAFEALAGRGITATVGGRSLLVGSARLMQERGVDLAALDEAVAPHIARGATLMFVAADGRALGAIAVGDALRPSASAAIRRLRDVGVEAVMLSGDSRAAAEAVGAELGIERVIAEVLPAQKAEHVESLRAEGHVVAMVGDGVNDAPALAAADVGFAMGGGTDVAVQTAAVTLMRSEPALVAAAIAVSRATARKIRQNLFWAFFYNSIGVPLAALGLLSPMMAGAAMALSSVSVVTNALLLRRAVPRRAPAERAP
ncbi:MAG: HAD-IC family P-type ATPase, partial [Myxococcales bacterium]|nr:HAD-IC family P-type ATPase [Myxococcales bacterium]